MTRVALITGGQQGIGLGIARALKATGHRIAILSEQTEGAAAVMAAKAELDALHVTHDLAETGQEAAVIERVADRLGPITAYVSNAGIPAPVRGDMLEMVPDSLDRVMAVNLRGAFFMAQAVARHMLAVPAGPYRSISFITSVSATMASVERAEYCLSKAGAAMMAQLYAARLAEAGIGVFDLRPGIIDTAMTAGVKSRYDDLIAGGLVPAKRWGHPADVGGVVAALAAGQFAFSTGAVIPVDGGLSIERL